MPDMTAQEIFAGLSPSEAGELLVSLKNDSREVYRAAVAALATRRNLRASFLDKKPLPERHAWMVRELTRAQNADVAIEVLQTWLVSSRKDMLRTFLDSLGIVHDGEGLVETLPAEPPRDNLEAAVAGLLAKFSKWEVRAYLQLFCEMDIADWPALREIVGGITAP